MLEFMDDCTRDLDVTPHFNPLLLQPPDYLNVPTAWHTCAITACKHIGHLNFTQTTHST